MPNPPVLQTNQPNPQEKLLGDRIEEALEKAGVKDIAKVYTRITKKPCNCQKRKQLLNNVHRKINQQIGGLRATLTPPKK